MPLPRHGADPVQPQRLSGRGGHGGGGAPAERDSGLAPGGRLLCAVAVTLAVQPGEYTLLPQTGGLTGGSPEPGLLHDRLESLPPVVVTRRDFAGVTPFYGLVDLPTDFAWAEEC